LFFAARCVEDFALLLAGATSVAGNKLAEQKSPNLIACYNAKRYSWFA